MFLDPGGVSKFFASFGRIATAFRGGRDFHGDLGADLQTMIPKYRRDLSVVGNRTFVQKCPKGCTFGFDYWGWGQDPAWLP